MSLLRGTVFVKSKIPFQEDIMRKLLITMVAGVTIFGFSAQADAKNNETFVQKGISCIQSLQQIDENKINEWINELYQKIDSKYVNKHIISNAIKNKPHIKEQIEDGTVNEEIVEEVEEEIEKEIEEENSTTVVDPTPSNPKVEQEEQSEVEQYGELTAEEA